MRRRKKPARKFSSSPASVGLPVGLTSRHPCASSHRNVPAPSPILVAMSGGVDSSVAALRLQQEGHAIVGAYMKNWINEDNVVGDCPWQRDIEDARAVCEKIGIEFRVVNLMREYRERVVAYLLDGYARG